MMYFQGELLEQIFNFYQGVREMHSPHDLLVSLTGYDNHFVTFCKEKNKENTKKLKNIRRFQTKNIDHYLKLKFWIVRDEELAKNLGIDTEGEVGDLYYIKESNDINQLECTANLEGKSLYCSKIMNISDPTKATEQYVDIISIALRFPIIVDDFMNFAQLITRYQSPSIIVY
jgi:hypothetical protein